MRSRLFSFHIEICAMVQLPMPKPRGREHTSLTETADLVVRELEKIPGIKMIAPGEIRKSSRTASGRFVTVSYTTAGFELLVSGQSTQKIAVHTENPPKPIIALLKENKKLREFVFKERERKPGI